MCAAPSHLCGCAISTRTTYHRLAESPEMCVAPRGVHAPTCRVTPSPRRCGGRSSESTTTSSQRGATSSRDGSRCTRWGRARPHPPPSPQSPVPHPQSPVLNRHASSSSRLPSQVLSPRSLYIYDVPRLPRYPRPCPSATRARRWHAHSPVRAVSSNQPCLKTNAYSPGTHISSL